MQDTSNEEAKKDAHAILRESTSFVLIAVAVSPEGRCSMAKNICSLSPELKKNFLSAMAFVMKEIERSCSEEADQ